MRRFGKEHDRSIEKQGISDPRIARTIANGRREAKKDADSFERWYRSGCASGLQEEQ